MIERKLLLLLSLIAFPLVSSAQISAKLMRYLDISDTHISFVYGGDIWIVAKEGGTAMQVTHSPGEESYPRFSPDGKFIAYNAAYNGNTDVYVIPSTGGVPTRVTYASHADRMIDWHPDGEHLLFASRREAGIPRVNQFYLVSKSGGFPEKLTVPYGELASYSPDGNKLVYITKITENYPFKRYRGGLTSDVIIFDLENNTAENITNNLANDGKPAWVGDKIYFLSDRDENLRLNLWAYDTQSKELEQITRFEDFDISYMSASSSELVFEAGGTLYKMGANSKEFEPVEVNVVSDLSVEIARSVDVSRRVNNMTLSPKGERVVFEARGELFDVPAEKGYSINLTRSSGNFDRDPSWSPDGKHIAYWSDRSGEYEIYLQENKLASEPRKLTNRNKGYGYTLYWSPDSKKIAFVDEKNDVSIIEVESGDTKVVGNYRWNIGHGGRFGYLLSWSPDSRWLSFTQGMDNGNDAIYLYNVEADESQQVTSGFYTDYRPTFSHDGKYLFFLTDRELSAAYSDLDPTWIYPNATKIAAVALNPEFPSLLHTQYDTVAVEIEVKEDKKEEKVEKEGDKEDDESLKLVLDGLEARVELLPPAAGNIGNITAVKGKLLYMRYPNTGSSDRTPKLMMYDLKEREEKEIMSGVNNFVLSGNKESILVSSRGQYGIIKAQPKQKIEKSISTDGLVMNHVPREEWKQIFRDTWRRHRDFFYDPAMHGLDWEAVGKQYEELLLDARTRWDVSFLQSNLAAELSAGHTYTFGGDAESVRFIATGYLGIDWAKEGGMYKIARIVKPAPWDTEVRSPFDRAGLTVAEGDFIHHVNGISLDPGKDPFAAFEGLSGKTIVLGISKTGKMVDVEEVVVKCLSQGEENNLRYLEWLEQNRQKIDELSDGQIGYIYMSNTSGRGQLELVRMFYGQLHKKGFIIDERFNGGGQLADRFLELLQRPVVYNLHWRHGKDHQWPIETNTGPMAMLVNGWAGSGGDALPWAFQELEAGPVIGERTLGILVGPATGHSLIDGGGITVPGARLYDNDGHWFWEGEGVTPDIKVWDDPNMLVKGRDPQLERGVEEVLKLLKTKAPNPTPAPEAENRTAKGLSGKK